MTEHTNQGPAWQPPPQQPQGGIYSPPPITPARPARKPNRWLLPTVVGFVTLIAGIGIGGAGSGETPEPTVETVTVDPDADRAAALDEREAELDGRESDLDEFTAELEARAAELGQAEDEVAANTVTDGIWTVGVDIEPGTYRATDVSADCYWGIYTSGSNGSDIINNGLPGGGNPTVTLEEGQDFESARCGEWTKQ